jgi:DNA polymerase III subunit delta
MQLSTAQLPSQLSKGLAPLYVLHGAEPLLIIEAGDAIRAAAKAKGYSERTLLQFEARSDWGQLAEAAGTLSLFGDLRVLDIRIPGGKTGKSGAEALIRFAKHLPEDTVSIVSLPALERDQFKAAWFNALSAAAVMVEGRAIEMPSLPAWLQDRAKKLNLVLAEDASKYIAQKVEGNLLAAFQELQKLVLLCPAGQVSLADAQEAVMDVARLNMQQLIAGMSAGRAVQALRAADSIKDQITGENKNSALIALLWPLAELLKSADSARLTKRFNQDELAQFARLNALIDRQAKGVAVGDPWDSLLKIIRLTCP